jgi:glycosyltransferase involved in cell wall biosynthesis
MRGEWQAVRRARTTFVCSEPDRAYLKRRLRLGGVMTLPNSVEIRTPFGAAAPDPTLLFLGSYGYEPNLRAAEFLIRQVWPRVRSRIPAARLILAGNHPERIAGYRSHLPGVEFTGFVDDLGALYGRSRVVCAPLLSGGGTRIKILEAVAYGRPVVATPIGAEGLDLRNDEEILIRQTAESFADACGVLLENPERCRTLGSRAHALVAREYGRPQIQGRIRAAFLDVAGSKPEAIPQPC